MVPMSWRAGRTGLAGERLARTRCTLLCARRARPRPLHPSPPLSRFRRRAGSVARCGQSTPPSKSYNDLRAPDSPSEIKPIYRRAASTKAGRVQRYLMLSARAEPPNAPGAGGSPWFLPVDGSGAPDGIDVSPQEWVDEWCARQRSPPFPPGANALR